MKCLVTSLSALLLFAGYSWAQVLNCNLNHGAGCQSSGSTFTMTFQGISSGQCGYKYNLKVTTNKGFECSFVTDNTPLPNTYRYTISHDPSQFYAEDTAYIMTNGSHTLLGTTHLPFSNRYEDNWLQQNNMHAPSGNSWARYEFTPRKLNYYSSNTRDRMNMGHNYLFSPHTRNTYIGLNKNYENNIGSGYGLCQIYCRILPEPQPSGQAGAPGSLGRSFSDRGGPSDPTDLPVPNAPPAPPRAASSPSGTPSGPRPGPPSGPPPPPGGPLRSF